MGVLDLSGRRTGNGRQGDYRSARDNGFTNQSHDGLRQTGRLRSAMTRAGRGWRAAARAVSGLAAPALGSGCARLCLVFVETPHIRGAGGVDLDAPGLQRLWHFPAQIDRKHAVVVTGGLDHDMIGQLELALKVARRDATMQIRAPVVIVALGPAAGDDQEVRLRGDFELMGCEPCRGQGDSIAVVAGLFDIVGGLVAISLRPHRAIDKVRHAVDADHRPVEGGEIIGRSHFHLLRRASWT